MLIAGRQVEVEIEGLEFQENESRSIKWYSLIKNEKAPKDHFFKPRKHTLQHMKSDPFYPVQIFDPSNHFKKFEKFWIT